MNLSLPFLGGTGNGSNGAILIDANIFAVDEITEEVTVDVNLGIDNNITQTALSVEVNTVNDITVEADAPAIQETVLDFSVESDVRSIDNEFFIPIERTEGEGFPVYLGELTTHSSTIAKLDMAAVITEEATAYIAGDVHPVNDVNVSVQTENTILSESTVVNVGNDISASDMQIKLEGTVESTDGTRITLEADRISEQDVSIGLSAEVLAVDVLLECVTVPEDQIVYKVGDIDRGMMDGVATIYPNEWSAMVINVPVLEDGSRATVSNFLMQKLAEKYGSDVHNHVSMIISRDVVTGEEYNFVVSESYTTPSGSINDFNLCTFEDEEFKAVPFIIKSTNDQKLTIEWEA